MKSSASSNNLKSAIKGININVRAVKVVYHCRSLCGPLHANNQRIIKLGFSVLLLGLAFRFLYNKSSNVSLVSGIPFLESTQISNVGSQENTDNAVSKENSTEFIHHREEKCDIYSGEWIPNKSGPSYTNKSCGFIQDHQNCIKNGRPDTDYLYWRWKPRDCELPQFDPERFLQLMRNKTWAFIGDSITRNHAQSFLCMLSTVEEAVEVSGYELRKWIFPSYNFTVTTIWSPFLAKAALNKDSNGVSTSDIEVNLDVLDKEWTDQFETFDYSIVSAGKWFGLSAIYYENSTILGCHSCKRNLTEVGFDIAYRKVINKVFDYIINSTSILHKGIIFYRTTTPAHFENGLWYNGGTCNRIKPAKEGELQLNILVKMLRKVELEEFEKASSRANKRGVDLNLFDVNPLSLLRPDGHPGPYRFFQPFAKGKDAKVVNDCLHWCLPGPIDSWNDLLMRMVGNG